MPAAIVENQHGDYLISTDPARVDLVAVHKFLSEQSYWAQGRPFEVQRRAIEHSALVVGAYTADAEQVAFAYNEEHRRRAGRVLVKGSELKFESTAMGNLAYVVDSRLGFHAKALATVVAEIPPGKRSGAHRHLYDEIDYVLAGSGRCIVDDQSFEIKKGDTLAIPVFGWHQYFNTGDAPLRILAHSTRPMLENLGLVLTHQGEHADH